MMTIIRTIIIYIYIIYIYIYDAYCLLPEPVAMGIHVMSQLLLGESQVLYCMQLA